MQKTSPNYLFSVYIIFVYVSLFAVSLSIYAQPKPFKKVTKSLLEEEQHSSYKDAFASVVYQNKSAQINFREGFYIEEEVHQVVKFYNRLGFSLGTFKIPIRKDSRGRSTKVLDLKLTTYNLVDNKIEKHSIKSSDAYEIDDNHGKELVITAPELKEGSVVEITYKTISYNLSYLTIEFLQNVVPIDAITYSFEVPDFTTYRSDVSGEEVKFNKSKRRSKIFSAALAGGGSYGNAFEVNFEKTTYWAENLSPVERDDFSGSYFDFLINVKNYLSAITPPNDVYHENFSKTWADLSKYIDESDRFGKRMLKFDKHLEKSKLFLVNQDASEFDKMQEVLNHVQTHMAFNQTYYPDKEASLYELYKNNAAGLSDINMILKCLLNANEIEANILLLGTNRQGKVKESNLAQLNKTLCVVHIEDETYLLDASSKHSAPNLIHPENFNGKSIEVLQNGDYNLHEIIAKEISQENFELYIDLSQNIANLNQYWSNHKALIAKENSGFGENTEIQLIESLSPIESDFIDFSIEQNTPTELSINSSFETEFDLDESMNFYSVPVFSLFKEQLRNPFIKNERVLPISFEYPFYKNYEVHIKYPNYISVEALPDEVKITLPDFMGSVSVVYTEGEGEVIAKLNFQINRTEIPVKRYAKLQSMYKALEAIALEEVVFKKV